MSADQGSTPFKIASAPRRGVIDQIFDDLLAQDMALFEQELETALVPQGAQLTDVERGIYRRGKKLRPAMLLLSARLVHGEGPLPSKVIKAAASLEMLHVATMIHDDIIDGALTRRGLESVNARRGINVAILVGDMQFVQAIRTFVDTIEVQSEMELVKLVLDTAFRICSGELDELETNRDLPVAALREHYFEVIERKTAIMFGLACETGISLARGHTSEARRIGFYGRRVGRAFQIVDDLMDLLQDDRASGKRRGIDLSRRVFTLPIIYAIESLGSDHLLTRVMRGQPASGRDLQHCIAAVVGSDGIGRAYADARAQALDALEYLNVFADNKYRRAMAELALYIVDRGF